MEEIENKLDLVLRNQEVLNKNQLIIYSQLLEIEGKFSSDSKEFIRNYIADIAGTVTAELGLIDILNSIKKI